MIDTHCHIDDPQYAAELDEVIRRQKEAGVTRILVPGVNRDSIETVLKTCARYPGYLLPALGLHPEDVKADYRDVLDAIHEAILQHGTDTEEVGSICAIGEIGLDYHFSTEYKTEQQDALRIQLGWAQEWNLPVMIHARDAAEDTLRILRSVADVKGVMHCYSGSYEMAMEYVRMGWYLGVGGVITFKNCKLAENLVPSDGRPAVPLDSLVLETDAPYMAPVPYRGKPNESRYMQYVVEKLSAAYQVSCEEVINRTNRAANALFGLKM